MPLEIEDATDETLVQKIAAWLKTNLPDNFEITGDDGTKTVGIIYAEEWDLKVKGITLKKTDRYYFGTIFTKRIGLSPMYRHTEETGPANWVFAVYGRKNLEIAKKLADKITEDFKVSVKVILWSKEPEKQLSLDSEC